MTFRVANSDDSRRRAARASWAPIYLRWRNLWPLTACHAVLGALVLYVLLHRHSWAGIEGLLG